MRSKTSRLTRISSMQSGDHSLQVADEFLPAVLCAPIVGLLLGTEAGLLRAQ